MKVIEMENPAENRSAFNQNNKKSTTLMGMYILASDLFRKIR